jgi:hypothetical protein
VEVLPNSRLLAEMTATHWRTRAGDVDVMNAIAGKDGRPLGFTELAPRAVTIHLGNVTVLVAGLGDIITAKERANRNTDREALPELRAIQARKASNAPPVPSPPLRESSASSRRSAARRRPLRISPGVPQCSGDEPTYIGSAPVA